MYLQFNENLYQFFSVSLQLKSCPLPKEVKKTTPSFKRMDSDDTYNYVGPDEVTAISFTGSSNEYDVPNVEIDKRFINGRGRPSIHHYKNTGAVRVPT